MVAASDHPQATVARDWYAALQECVRAVDYTRAQPLFAADVVSFGTHATIVAGLDNLQREQWQNVWPRIRDFTFRLADLHCVGGEDGFCAIVPWDSLGVRPDGTTFSRPGRATVMLVRRDDRWLAVHSHFSLAPVVD
jgi:ketosteroid isomerase-like protein